MTPAISRCYHPGYAHATCQGGHPVHLDPDHYDTPRWVHCLIVDLVECPYDMEDVTGAAAPGQHRKATA